MLDKITVHNNTVMWM